MFGFFLVDDGLKTFFLKTKRHHRFQTNLCHFSIEKVDWLTTDDFLFDCQPIETSIEINWRNYCICIYYYVIDQSFEIFWKSKFFLLAFTFGVHLEFLFLSFYCFYSAIHWLFSKEKPSFFLGPRCFKANTEPIFERLGLFSIMEMDFY